jgi:hypothetical protein
MDLIKEITNVKMELDGFELFLNGLPLKDIQDSRTLRPERLKPEYMGEWRIHTTPLDFLLGIVTAFKSGDGLTIRFFRFEEDKPRMIDAFDRETDPNGDVWEHPGIIREDLENMIVEWTTRDVWCDMMVESITVGLHRIGALKEDKESKIKEKPGRRGLDRPELVYRVAKAQEGEEIRAKDSQKPWKEIAKEISWYLGMSKAGIKLLEDARYRLERLNLNDPNNILKEVEEFRKKETKTI